MLAEQREPRYTRAERRAPQRERPFEAHRSEPNYWLSCLLISEDAMAPYVRGEQDELWQHESGKSSPGEILNALSTFGAEGRPIWKPMHMQPIYRNNKFVTVNGNGRGQSNAYNSEHCVDVGAKLFRCGLCLPSDNKMTPEQQDKVIEIVRRCFQ